MAGEPTGLAASGQRLRVGSGFDHPAWQPDPGERRRPPRVSTSQRTGDRPRVAGACHQLTVRVAGLTQLGKWDYAGAEQPPDLVFRT